MLSIATTETLQALLNRKSKGCLKKHSLSLESQRSPIATHNPKVAGSSPAPATNKTMMISWSLYLRSARSVQVTAPATKKALIECLFALIRATYSLHATKAII
jgi:hypothetical protein